MVDALSGFVLVSALVWIIPVFVFYWWIEDFWGIVIGLIVGFSTNYWFSNLIWGLGKKVAGI
jgi:hypothetical protein